LLFAIEAINWAEEVLHNLKQLANERITAKITGGTGTEF
jgi:hypothetical protein